MRSFIIIEVEHGEDTDMLTDFTETIENGSLHAWVGLTVSDYSVAVDVPAHSPTPDKVAGILSL